MGNFIRFIVRNLHFILFLVLEIISINLAVNYNNRRKTLFLSTANEVSGFFQKRINRVNDYFHLGKENQLLVRENARLREEVLNLKQPGAAAFERDTISVENRTDSIVNRYSVIPAEVISNSFSSLQNYITINAGSLHGIKTGMGVIAEHGPVGIVAKTSRRYSKVISLYNIETSVSAMVSSSKALGVIQWEPFNLEYVVMREIPRHVEIEVGDTIVTSGYSFSFPAGLPIGTIDHYNLESGENDYTVYVRLLEKLYTLQNCYVIDDSWRYEDDHELQISDDE